MPTESENVCLSGKAGSDGRAARATRLTVRPRARTISEGGSHLDNCRLVGWETGALAIGPKLPRPSSTLPGCVKTRCSFVQKRIVHGHVLALFSDFFAPVR